MSSFHSAVHAIWLPFALLLFAALPACEVVTPNGYEVARGLGDSLPAGGAAGAASLIRTRNAFYYSSYPRAEHADSHVEVLRFWPHGQMIVNSYTLAKSPDASHAALTQWSTRGKYVVNGNFIAMEFTRPMGIPQPFFYYEGTLYDDKIVLHRAVRNKGRGVFPLRISREDEILVTYNLRQADSLPEPAQPPDW